MIAAWLAVLLAPTIAFRVDDPRIAEASGIAAGLRSPGIVYMQDDSGDRNRFFAVNARTGATAATITVPGATNVDWEDIAVATDADGTPSVWLADTGDNAGERDEVQVYRVDEPRVTPGDDDRDITATDPDVIRLTYPGGPRDAEALAVAPGGVGYVVTKTPIGASEVYRVPNRSAPMRRVGELQLGLGGLATGAAFSRDGRTLAVRTYTQAFVWPVSGGDVAAAIRGRPAPVTLPTQQQGEGIAVDGDRLLVNSEGVGQPVYAIPLPAAVATTTPAGTPTPTTTRTPAPDDGGNGAPGGIGLLVVAALFGGGYYLMRRNRPR